MRKTIILGIAVLFSISLFAGMTPTAAQAKTRFVTIGTGGG